MYVYIDTYILEPSRALRARSSCASLGAERIPQKKDCVRIYGGRGFRSHRIRSGWEERCAAHYVHAAHTRVIKLIAQLLFLWAFSGAVWGLLGSRWGLLIPYWGCLGVSWGHPAGLSTSPGASELLECALGEIRSPKMKERTTTNENQRKPNENRPDSPRPALHKPTEPHSKGSRTPMEGRWPGSWAPGALLENHARP